MFTVLNKSKAHSTNSTQSSSTEQLVEVSIFLFLIVPSMVLSFFAVKQGTLSFVLVAFATILRDLALVSLILFFSGVMASVSIGLAEIRKRLERDRSRHWALHSLLFCYRIL